MFGAFIRAAGRWKPIQIAEPERRQLSAIKRELDRQYEGQDDIHRKTVKGCDPYQLSSSAWLDPADAAGLNAANPTNSSLIR